MAIRINRVYTRTGDDGKTALADGSRVAKTSLRIAAYGEVDELNSVVGIARAELGRGEYVGNADAARLDAVLGFLQQELFDLGAELATPPEGAYEGMIRVGDTNIARLEKMIDELQDDLEPLTSFILPGGGPAGAALHLARTVCRRAERTATALVEAGEAEAGPARYLNRLSDLLFVQSRWIAVKSDKAETLWQKGLEPPPPGRKARRAGRGASAKGAKGQEK